ncbi:uncharacterized protein LOC115759002 isoform X2 [Drosophila novamexicana]|uniref:uncharacterized protein LOC115759002 isoform X2 n=1 Tax=Drosophila novamexicana TaxID=47314 RepID=UPI0011E5D582|nr:uncharacterized protein LOC115759002 isoform X2 [Drosophila novamexicana]
MLMPVLEYNKHIAKIPNCKMRSLRACMQQLLLLLLLSGHSDVCRALDIATSNGGGGGGSSTGSGSGSAPGMGAGGSTALSGPPGALNANLTELGSPGADVFCCSLVLVWSGGLDGNAFIEAASNDYN